MLWKPYCPTGQAYRKGVTYGLCFVLDRDGNPLMPTTRCGKVRRMLKNGQAEVVSRIPFTIRLCYEPASKETQRLVYGCDPGGSLS